MAWNEPGPNRDPWNSGGGRKGDGPPDLDEVLKRLRKRFSGNKGSGGGGNRPTPAGVPLRLAGVAVLVAAVLWGLSGFFVVDEQERAVILQFGAYDRTDAPGLRWHAPWPIERAEVVNVTRVRQVEDRQSMLTRDENIVYVEVKVQYRVSSAENYKFQVDDPDMTLRQATKSALREAVGKADMDFILTEGRQAIADQTKVQLQDLLDNYRTGLIVTEVNLQQAQPPDEVQSAFADAIKAREDQERVKNEAEAYANDRLPRARGQAAREIEQATAYRDRVVAEAKGDAARFSQLLAEYQMAPQVTRERLYLDSMNSVLQASSKVMIDTSKGSPFYFLPLDQLGAGGATSASGNSAADAASYLLAPGAAAAAQSGLNGSSRDSSRSRERGR